MTPRPESPRRHKGPESLARSISAITRPLFGKRGLAEGSIIARWADIVGTDVARNCVPEGIAFPPGQRQNGTLQIRVDGGSAAVELQHLSPILIERVNGYFGYPAVARVRLVQGPVPRRPQRAKRVDRPLNTAEEDALTAMLETVTDPDLRQTLSGLGRALIARRGNAIKPR